MKRRFSHKSSSLPSPPLGVLAEVLEGYGDIICRPEFADCDKLWNEIDAT